MYGYWPQIGYYLFFLVVNFVARGVDEFSSP